MLEHIKENRVKCTEGSYMMTLEIPEKVVYSAYDEPNDEAIIEILLSYLLCIDEEGEPKNVSIIRNEEKGIFKVEMELHYCNLGI
jgi:hypothetical protein